MSIHVICGKPRAGKTLYSVHLILRELAYGSRAIITNVPLNIPQVNQYLQQKHPNINCCSVTRILTLTDEQVMTFWAYRARYLRPKEFELIKLEPTRHSPSSKHSNSLDLYEFTADSNSGVFYAIDECHLILNARAWSTTAAGVLQWARQHGHLHDDALLITHAEQDLDKQLRVAIQDYTYLRNFKKNMFFTLFKGPPLFLKTTYYSPPGKDSTPMITGTFKLDASGIAACYSTVAGIGITGGPDALADTHDKISGLPLWILIPIIIMTFYLVYIGSDWIAHAFAKPIANAGKSALAHNAIPIPNFTNTQQTETTLHSLDEYPQIPSETNRTYHQSVHDGPIWHVWTPDGRHYRTGDGRLRFADDNSALIDNTLWLYDPLPEKPAETPQTSPYPHQYDHRADRQPHQINPRHVQQQTSPENIVRQHRKP